MKRVQFRLSIGYAGASHEQIFEFDDDTPSDEIEQDYQDWCSNYLDGGWWFIDEDGERQ